MHLLLVLLTAFFLTSYNRFYRQNQTPQTPFDSLDRSIAHFRTHGFPAHMPYILKTLYTWESFIPSHLERIAHVHRDSEKRLVPMT